MHQMTTNKLRDRQGVPFRLVAAGLVGLLIAALAFGFFIYLKIMRYERVALRHVPPGAEAVVVLDVEQRVLFEPIRKFLVPALDVSHVQGNLPGTRLYPGRLARLKGRTGLELGVDLREIVVAVGSGARQWVVLLGGLFPRVGLLEGLQSVLREEGHHWALDSKRGRLVAPGGLTVTHCEDGVIIVASSQQWASLAIPDREIPEILRLPRGSVGAFVNRSETLSKLGSGPIAAHIPEFVAFKELKTLSGRLELGPGVSPVVQLHFGPGFDAEQNFAELKRLRDKASQSATLVPLVSWLGSRPLAEADVAVRPDGIVEIRANWTEEDLDRTIGSAVSAVGAMIRRRVDETTQR